MRDDLHRRYLAANLRRLRENKKLSQEQLAEACGLYRTHVGNIERMDYDPTLSTLTKLAAGLGVPLDRLIAKPPKNAKSKPLPRGPKPGQRLRVRARSQKHSDRDDS